MTAHDRPPAAHARHTGLLLTALATLVAAGCGGDDIGRAATRPPAPWVDQPVSEWPDFALSSDVVFEDTTYAWLAATPWA
ncbi:MAG: hypothetical protein ACN0LA_06480 [Candidatus Longimicrobiales bacterium M2_2A_002]